MNPTDLIDSQIDPENIIADVLRGLHESGPIDPASLEILSYLKKFHPTHFAKIEKKLMFLLGLFYKAHEPDDLLSFSYSAFKNSIFNEFNQDYTPIQASIRRGIESRRYYSFSAPTSAGKSYLFRDLIENETGDVVIVVPSRALIAEYIIEVEGIVEGQKDVLVLQFIDDINKIRTSRKIFIVTPERASDLFKAPEHYQVSMFLFDEAQIADEMSRGMIFDSLVRRIKRVFADSKLVFAHPFILNPEAQLKRHELKVDSSACNFPHNSVGKICLHYHKQADSFSYFSPYIDNGHLKANKKDCKEGVVKTAIENNGSVLVYASKKSIYDKSVFKTFSAYIEMCREIDSPDAIEIITQIEDLIGAKGRNSDLIRFMKKGIVIHHGSIPLNVRYLIEKFTNLKFAKICFATSTLLQGINMPFDVVWIDNFRFQDSNESPSLGLKNLIGRAGRNTNTKGCFDFGYVVVTNIQLFTEKLNMEPKVSEVSHFERPVGELEEDSLEFIQGIKDGNFQDEYNLPDVVIDRINNEEIHVDIGQLLDLLFVDGEIINGDDYRELSDPKRRLIKDLMKGIFSESLGRKLTQGEQTILSSAINILLWQIQGKRPVNHVLVESS